MKLMKLAVAAALAASSLTVTVEPAGATQRGDRWHNDRGRHYGWRNHRRHRVCRWVWRHHHRQRVCYWTYRRWR